jgi:photosystem I reaction center subunit XII
MLLVESYSIKIILYKIYMLSDSQILLALAVAIMPSLLAVRLGTALNDN